MKRIISVALVLMMVLALATAAFSAATDESPTGKKYYDIVVDVDGKGYAATDKNKVEIKTSGDGMYVTLTATDGEETFDKWTIDGKYEVIEGSTTSRIMVVKPNSNIAAVAHFVGKGGASTPDQKPTEKPNTSGTSPKTGDPAFMIIMMVLAAMGVGVFAFKKVKG